MRGLWLFVLCGVLICFVGSGPAISADQKAMPMPPLPPMAAAADNCVQCPASDSCTLEMTASAVVEAGSACHKAGCRKPVRAVVRRSVCAAGCVAVAPVRVVAKIVEARPARKVVKVVVKVRPAKRVAGAAARLICLRCRCDR